MNRNQEYLLLMEELNAPPAALEGSVPRAGARARQRRRARRAFGIPTGVLAAAFALFFLAVNLSPTIAYAAGQVPGLAQLAKAVALSPSLKAAVENKYVQPVGLSKTSNGITMTVEYIIVDQRQLNLFYTLDSKQGERLVVDFSILSSNEGALHYGGSLQPEDGIYHFTADFISADMPGHLQLQADVRSFASLMESAPLAGPPPPSSPNATLASFVFELEFEPQFTEAGRHIPIDQQITIGGQQFTVDTVDVYPTHIQLHIRADSANTKRLERLDYTIIHEDGTRVEPIKNGITGSFAEDGSLAVSRIESNYFKTSPARSIEITGATFLDPSLQTTRINLEQGSASYLPKGVQIHETKKENNDWKVVFSSEVVYGENHHHQLFKTSYEDENGNELDTNGYSSVSSPDDDGRFLNTYYLRNYPGKFVYMHPSFTEILWLDAPIQIAIEP